MSQSRIQEIPQGSEPLRPIPQTLTNYLNLGCGHRYHRDWVNVDFSATGEGVIAHNLTQGIPFENETFDVVYHSHVLEHFSKAGAIAFLQDCYRVLRPGGILRVVVPDLEQIARMYLKSLEAANSGALEWADHYQWMLLELFDQTVRNRPGGEMLEYLQSAQIPNAAFVIDRCGTEIKEHILSAKNVALNSSDVLVHPLKLRLKALYRMFYDRAFRREVWLKRVLGEEYAALEVGRFRLGGEVHQWMYDRYSLAQLLQQCGFQQIVQRSATESYLSTWQQFNLDTEADHSVYKPDSLFMEAIKPTVY